LKGSTLSTERAAVTPKPDSTSAKQAALVRPWATYPPHPPLSDVPSAPTSRPRLAILGRSGMAAANLAKGRWLALPFGLSASVPTALTGFLEFVVMGGRNPARRTTIAHLLLMLSTYPFFIEAARRGHGGYVEGEIATTPLALTLIGLSLLSLGALVGGKLVYQHGLRVRPARQAPGEQQVVHQAERSGR
jgi:uncharacterized membrane protein